MISICDIIHIMNSKQKRTLKTIYTDPVSSSLVWKDIESLFFVFGSSSNRREWFKGEVL